MACGWVTFPRLYGTDGVLGSESSRRITRNAVRSSNSAQQVSSRKSPSPKPYSASGKSAWPILTSVEQCPNSVQASSHIFGSSYACNGGVTNSLLFSDLLLLHFPVFLLLVFFLKNGHVKNYNREQKNELCLSHFLLMQTKNYPLKKIKSV